MFFFILDIIFSFDTIQNITSIDKSSLDNSYENHGVYFSKDLVYEYRLELRKLASQLSKKIKKHPAIQNHRVVKVLYYS